MATSMYFAGFDLVTRDSDGAILPLANTDVFIYGPGMSLLDTAVSDDFGYVAPVELFGTPGDELTFEADGYVATFTQIAQATQELAFINCKVLTFIADDDYVGETEPETIDLYLQDLTDTGTRPVYIGSTAPNTSFYHSFESGYGKDVRVFAIAKDAQGRQSTVDFPSAPNVDYSVPSNRGVLGIGDDINASTANRFLVVGAGGVLAETPTISALQSSRRNSAGTAWETFTATIDGLLPSQSGNSGKFLTTNGSAASWASISTGITIGSTSITSGTNNRVLFQASGVVSQSGNFTFDGNTLQSITGSNSAVPLRVKGASSQANNANYFDIRRSDDAVLFSVKEDSVGGVMNLHSNNGSVVGFYRVNSAGATAGLEIAGYNALNLINVGSTTNPLQVKAFGSAGGLINLQYLTYYSNVYFSGYTGAGTNGGEVVFDDIQSGLETMHIYTSNNSNMGVRFLHGKIVIGDAVNFELNTTTGTKIGTASTQKLGFYGVTPVVQPSDIGAITDSTTGTATRTLSNVDDGGGGVDIDVINSNFATIADWMNDLRTGVVRPIGITG